jgi:FdhE protein
MNAVIEELIRKKPHLAEPLRFYEKAVRFTESVRELASATGPGQVAYAPDVINRIFDRFSSFIDLPDGSLDPLKRAMELGEIDFTRLPLNEVPAFSLPYPEDDLSILLFLVSKPFFLALREARRLDGRMWEEGRCPVCSGEPAVTWIGKDGRRLASCSYCGTTGRVNSPGCTLCRIVDASKQGTLEFEHEAGFKINTCDRCHSYVKTIDEGMIVDWSPEVADLISLPIDIVVQEKGFVRRSPNPIGMRKMSARG